MIASRLGEGISAKCQSSGIAKNGDYLAIVAHIDPNNWMNILGTYVYRSTDKGITWDTGTKISTGGTPIIGYSGDVSGFRTLSNGRIILWGWDMNKKSFAVYSDVMTMDILGLIRLLIVTLTTLQSRHLLNWMMEQL